MSDIYLLSRLLPIISRLSMGISFRLESLEAARDCRSMRNDWAHKKKNKSRLESRRYPKLLIGRRRSILVWSIELNDWIRAIDHRKISNPRLISILSYPTSLRRPSAHQGFLKRSRMRLFERDSRQELWFETRNDLDRWLKPVVTRNQLSRWRRLDWNPTMITITPSSDLIRSVTRFNSSQRSLDYSSFDSRVYHPPGSPSLGFTPYFDPSPLSSSTSSSQDFIQPV